MVRLGPSTEAVLARPPQIDERLEVAAAEEIRSFLLLVFRRRQSPKRLSDWPITSSLRSGLRGRSHALATLSLL